MPRPITRSAAPSCNAGILVQAILMSLCRLALSTSNDNLSLCDTAVIDVHLRSTGGRLGVVSEGPGSTISFTGRFGNHSPHASLSSDRVVHVRSATGHGLDRTGCNRLSYNAPSAREEKWVAVLQRGDCPFEQKIEIAVAHGAGAVIIYNRAGQSMEPIAHGGQRELVVLVDDERGRWLSDALDSDGVARISIRPQESSSSRLDGITIFFACAMILPALLLNGAALASILMTSKKLKPHVYLIINLIVTDLQVAAVSAAQVGTLFGGFHDMCADDEQKKPARCAAGVLSRFWNVLLYSNMLTLLLLTAEHFVACRWPLRHKVFLTRGKVLAGIACSWTLACLPDVAAIAVEASAGESAAGDGVSMSTNFCEFVHRYSLGYEKWQASAIFVAVVTVLLTSLLGVYGYILWVIHTASIGKLEAKRKRNAIVTSLLLLASCCVSYIFHYMLQFSIAVEHTSESSLVTSYRKFLHALFPTSPLVIDYLLTGVLGAILDPLIYCSRTKEVKSFLSRFITMRHSSSSGSGAATNLTPLAREHQALAARERL